MSVTQFDPLPHDLDAKVNYPRENPNDGQLYALIKISTGLNCDGFTRFDFGSVGYGEVDCTRGTWVYAPATASRISITHTLGGTLENYLLPAPLEAGRVYSMTLTGGRVYTHVEETLNVGYLSVDCNVPGATLRLGTQEPKVMTDMYYSTTIAPGTYDYEVTAVGYEPERGRITVQQEKNSQLTVRLVSSSGTLQVHSEPAGAAILVDGQLQNAHTPATLTLLKGTHRVMLTKDLYKATEQEVTIQPGGTGEVHLALAPDFAPVEVQAASPGDSIYIDRQFRATGTWRGDLASGLHVLEASRASHRPYRRDFSVKVGQPLSLSSPALEPMYGKLQVLVTNNQKASVYIDGEQRSPFTPCMVQDVLVGQRAVRIVPENEDYQPYETYVAIREGKVETVEAGLEEKPKTGSIYADANVAANVYVDGEFFGHAPQSITLPLGKHEVVWEYGKMKEREVVKVDRYGQNVYKNFRIKYQKPKKYIAPKFFMDYRISFGTFGTSGVGFGVGYGGRWGGYAQWRMGVDPMHFTAGIMYRPISWFALQGGLGYGMMDWYEVFEYGNKQYGGFEFEIGTIFTMWNWLAFSAGYTCVPSLNGHEFYMGIGISI